ncbi:hypothetical protein Pmani_019836 [Petrolisthes manimaculis]|uniref:Uncharacterized protein n=1 Tax=Petrolisthes manimaculis TaxID=1843537 RepID=A0AAE1PJL6_9EUCA|nr:hypothetical protein Pmani_019836 [Petrolisthes manimaculis]
MFPRCFRGQELVEWVGEEKSGVTESQQKYSSPPRAGTLCKRGGTYFLPRRRLERHWLALGLAGRCRVAGSGCHWHGR